jgi:hypothetical protein
LRCQERHCKRYFFHSFFAYIWSSEKKNLSSVTFSLTRETFLLPRLIGKLTAFFQLQEFSLRKPTVTSSTSAARLSLPSSKAKLT